MYESISGECHKKEQGFQLRAIGEHWAKGGAKTSNKADNSLRKDLSFFGATEAALPAWMRENKEDRNVFYVMARDVQAFTIFAHVITQWRVGFSGVVGLDYNVVFSVMDRMLIESNMQLIVLSQVQAIESAFLAKKHQK